MDEHASPPDDTALSKRLAYVLRHDPGSVGLVLDEGGWADVDVLVAALAAHGVPVDRERIERVVATNDKRRYVLRDGRIRASQGHSVPVDLGLVPVVPPPVLYHGTVGRHLASIRASGLRPGSRHHVHLSGDRATAERVGGRRGVPVVLTVAAGRMAEAGFAFYRSENGVWLTAHVPPGYLG